jgi:predicted anti-sigma-YlaC factor YlaD
MIGDASNLTCTEFQEQLSELIGTGEDISSHPHLQTCELCRALLADLETIAAAARELFPIAEPREDLWDGIIAAIENDPQSAKPEPGIGNLDDALSEGLSI